MLRLARGSYRPKQPAGNWFLDVEKSGGLLLDLMIHDFDYARWVAGEVESVFARSIGSPRPGRARVDYGLAILRHRGGALSHVAGAWAYPPPTFRTGLEIAGDGGLIEFDSTATAPIELLLGTGAMATRPMWPCRPARCVKAPTPPRSRSFTRALARRPARRA